jgi:hypothetical protein
MENSCGKRLIGNVLECGRIHPICDAGKCGMLWAMKGTYLLQIKSSPSSSSFCASFLLLYSLRRFAKGDSSSKQNRGEQMRREEVASWLTIQKIMSIDNEKRQMRRLERDIGVWSRDAGKKTRHDKSKQKKIRNKDTRRDILLKASSATEHSEVALSASFPFSSPE